MEAIKVTVNFKEIAKQILENGNDIVGIRSMCNDEDLTVGVECRESYEWDFENDCSTYLTTGETVGGTCATAIETSNVWFNGFDDDDIETLANNLDTALKAHIREGYSGDKVIILGDSLVPVDGHFDPGEIRIEGAKIFKQL